MNVASARSASAACGLRMGGSLRVGLQQECSQLRFGATALKGHPVRHPVFVFDPLERLPAQRIAGLKGQGGGLDALCDEWSIAM